MTTVIGPKVPRPEGPTTRTRGPQHSIFFSTLPPMTFTLIALDSIAAGPRAGGAFGGALIGGVAAGVLYGIVVLVRKARDR